MQTRKGDLYMLYTELKTNQGIHGLTGQAQNGLCTLRWLWPRDAEAVYIEKVTQMSAVGEEGYSQSDQPDSAPASLRLYTKEEYKANNGSYTERVDHFGRMTYTVYLTYEEQGETVLVRQPDGQNTIELSAGKAKIYYSIKQQGTWFGKRKTVRIEVHAEVPIPKEVLCYVKKEGGYATNKDDGIIYPFAAPFQAGRNELPAIEVGKNEYVRLFFTDGRTYGQMYELILE